jgi:asparagine synthase (glutamine-hydrolysing)
MCGLFGYVGSKRNLNEELMKCIVPRGPDSQNILVENNITLGHSRLNVIGLDDLYNQPMQKNNIILIFNGEIYNYKEIAQELGLQNIKSDTEVIIYSYMKWGFDCVKKFHGMWAFCILDIKENILFLSRDRFGMKPLYFGFDDKDNFVFGSTIKTILLHQKKHAPNFSVLKGYLLKGLNEITQETCFKNVFSLLPATNLIYDLHKKFYKEYTHYTIAENNIINDDIFIKKFNKSIERHLVSDVPIACLLSGGIDSSSIVLAASYKGQNNVICLDTTNEYASERYLQDYTINNLNLNGNIINFKPDFSKFYDLISIQEEPITNSSEFSRLFLYENIKNLGYKVILDGAGGDEILNGYFTEIMYYSIYNSSLMERIKIYITILKIKSYRKYFFKFLFMFYLPNRLLFWIYQRRLTLIKFSYAEFKKFILSDYTGHEGKKIFSKRFYESIIALNRTTDKTSMSFGIETRMPFEDSDLADYCVGARQSSVTSNKAPLRRFLQDKLPLVANNHEKKGLAQLDEEFSNEKNIKLLSKFMIDFKDEYENILGKPFEIENFISNRKINSSIFFKLLMIGVWLDTFFKKS